MYNHLVQVKKTRPIGIRTRDEFATITNVPTDIEGLPALTPRLDLLPFFMDNVALIAVRGDDPQLRVVCSSAVQANEDRRSTMIIV